MSSQRFDKTSCVPVGVQDKKHDPDFAKFNMRLPGTFYGVAKENGTHVFDAQRFESLKKRMTAREAMALSFKVRG